MTVYVDDMRANFGNMIMCHMVADTDEELHAMADAIGISRRHWQAPGPLKHSHYDIALSKKALALRLGAVPITQRQAAAMCMHRRRFGLMGNPEGAIAWSRGPRDAPMDSSLCVPPGETQVDLF